MVKPAMVKAIVAAVVALVVLLVIGVYVGIYFLLVYLGAPKWAALTATLVIGALTTRLNTK